MNLLYLIPAALLLAIWALCGHREAVRLRALLDEDQAIALTRTASQLDAALERIVPPGSPAVSVHQCGCAVVFHDGGNARLAPCPGHERHHDWQAWERQMKERSK